MTRPSIERFSRDPPGTLLVVIAIPAVGQWCPGCRFRARQKYLERQGVELACAPGTREALARSGSRTCRGGDPARPADGSYNTALCERQPAARVASVATRARSTAKSPAIERGQQFRGPRPECGPDSGAGELKAVWKRNAHREAAPRVIQRVVRPDDKSGTISAALISGRSLSLP